jgi:hypothetical protein
VPVNLIDGAAYESIRRAIDVRLDARSLPDAVIALPIYAGSGELDVRQRDPLLDERVGTDLAHARLAAIYFAAARLTPAVPDIVQQTFMDYRYVKSPRDIEAQVSRLNSLGEGEMAAYLTGGDEAALYPMQHFVRVRGTRL